MSVGNGGLRDILISVENEDLPDILLNVESEHVSHIPHNIQDEDVQCVQFNIQNEDVTNVPVNFENENLYDVSFNVEGEDFGNDPHNSQNAYDNVRENTENESLAAIPHEVQAGNAVDSPYDAQNGNYASHYVDDEDLADIQHDIENREYAILVNVPQNDEENDLADGPLEISIDKAPRYAARKRRRRELKAQREAEFPTSSSDEAPPRKVRRRLPRRREQYEEVAPTEVQVVQENRRMMNRILFDRVCEDFVESVVPRLSDSQFKGLFRVSRNTWKQIHDCFCIIAEDLVPNDKRTSVPLKDYILMFLWFIGTGRTFEGLSETFDVDLEEAINVIDVCLKFFNTYSPKLLPFPTSRTIANRYAVVFSEIYGFPNAIGCLTMRHFLIRKSVTSIPRVWCTVQTVTDARGRFLHVHLDTMKMHPRDILDQSKIADSLSDFPYGRYHLVADENHFVRRWLLTPFEHAEATNEILFNSRHKTVMDCGYKAWHMVENRFGMLKSPHLNGKYVHGIVRACCMVQNVCTDERDYFDLPDWRESSWNRPTDIVRPVNVIQDDPDLRSLGLLRRRQTSHDME